MSTRLVFPYFLHIVSTNQFLRVDIVAPEIILFLKIETMCVFADMAWSKCPQIICANLIPFFRAEQLAKDMQKVFLKIKTSLT